MFIYETVEEASARAAAVTFGQKAAAVSAGKHAVQSAVVDAHLHEAAFSEGYQCITDSPVAAVYLSSTVKLCLSLLQYVCLGIALQLLLGVWLLWTMVLIQ